MGRGRYLESLASPHKNLSKKRVIFSFLPHCGNRPVARIHGIVVPKGEDFGPDRGDQVVEGAPGEVGAADGALDRKSVV